MTVTSAPSVLSAKSANNRSDNIMSMSSTNTLHQCCFAFESLQQHSVLVLESGASVAGENKHRDVCNVTTVTYAETNTVTWLFSQSDDLRTTSSSSLALSSPTGCY